MQSIARASTLLLVLIVLPGCAGAGPFTVQTPGLGMLEEEAPHLSSESPAAMRALGGATLQGRVQNLVSTYEDELERAEGAQGGVLNTALSVLALVLPLSGTAGAIGLSDPDDVQTVSIVAGTATTVVMAINLLFKPGARKAEASQCADFLASALEAIRTQWQPGELDSLTGTEEEWDRYLTVRATLEPARASACPG